MSRIRLPRHADRDLEEIWRFIAEDSVRHADRMIDRLKAKFLAIAKHPELGEACPDLAKNLREFPVGSYVIYYMPLEDGIAVVRVIHGARDTSSLDFE